MYSVVAQVVTNRGGQSDGFSKVCKGILRSALGQVDIA